MKRRRILGTCLAIGVFALLLTACISDSTRGWGAPVPAGEQQLVTSTKGKLDGIPATSDPAPAWTGELTQPLGQQDSRIQGASLSPTDTPFVGDLLQIESEIVRVRSLDVNGAERELILDRGFAGTVASSHAVGTPVEAIRRAWRFPDDWHIREGDARGLSGIYATPVLDSDGTLYVADYDGWVYAFEPDNVNLDAADDDDEPDTALVNLGNQIVGGIALDESSGLLYVTAADELYAIDTERLKAALTAGGGVIEPEATFNFTAGDEIWAAPTVADGAVYVSSLDGKLYSLDPATGTINWEFDAGRGLATTPVVAGDLVLVGGFDSRLYAVNIADGTEAWQYRTPNWVLATPVVDDGIAYFGDFDSVLHAVEIESGASEWTLPLNRGKIRASAAIVGDSLVLGTDDGWVIGVSIEEQQRIWEQDLGTGIHADLVASGDEVLLAPDDCVALSGSETEVYYRAVEPDSGTLKRVEGIC